MKYERITINPDQMGGVPCIRGQRIPVATVAGMMAEGMSERKSSTRTLTWSVKIFAKPCGTRLKQRENERFRLPDK